MRINLLKEWNITGNSAENGLACKGLSIAYKAQENAIGWYPIGFEKGNDTTFDAIGWLGLVLEVKTGLEETNLRVKANLLEHRPLLAEVSVHGAGTHKLTVRLQDFNIEHAKQNIWRFLQSFEVDGEAELLTAWLCKRESIYVESSIRGKSGNAGETVSYTAVVHNCMSFPQAIDTKQDFQGWESLTAIIEPARFTLPPNGKQTVTISVFIHDYMPQGSHENTTIRWIPSGNGAVAETVTYTSLSRLPHPYIYHNTAGWAATKEKINRYDKFKPGYGQYIKAADTWVAQPPNDERDYLYQTKEEDNIMACAYAYALTNDEKYAQKLATFFRYFISEINGYPIKKKGCSQSYVQEGHFFQHLAIAYDIVHNSCHLTADDHKGIEKCFRIYMGILDYHLRSGHISNWLLSEITGALYCALSIEDMHMALRFVNGPGGTIEQLEKGIFNDGWWYECSVSYNTWVSSMLIHTAHALLPFGYNLLHTHFRPPYNKQVGSTYGGLMPPVRFGMYNEKWGGNTKNYICIKDIFDAVLPFLDYRGVLFGICDSAERKLGVAHFGSTYDLAYHYYKDPKYLPLILQSDFADPIFGIGELPDYEPNPYTNAFSDNIGIAMLRSKAAGREPREQIQAVLRYGSHGYAHGHFDRASLLSVMRYGKSFFNPEHVWWGYPHFMYKFYVQNSITKNMVVVDEKFQVPSDSKRTLFYSGKHMQVACVETTSKWSYPPYGGMVYNTGETLEDRCKMNGSSLPKLANPPGYGELTGFTEEIVQKRVMAVMDDYIVLFDYLEGDVPHQYDSLFQIKGFLALEGESITPTGHKSQFTTNPLSDGQFITDCQTYEVNGTSVARFATVFGQGEDMRGTRSYYNEPGVLKMDIYSAWPKQTEQIIGLAAEDHDIRIPLKYMVEADGVNMASGAFGAWILGEDKVDIDITSVKSLSLRVFNEPTYNENNYPRKTKQSLFWGEAYIVNGNGERQYIHELSPIYENIDLGYGIGKDYENGRVLIVGNEYANAIPTSPQNHENEGVITVDLTGLDAVQFVGLIGADGFPGDEAQRRKTYAVRQHGKIGRFITVIEPYEEKQIVSRVTATSENQVEITCHDGRVHVISAHDIQSNAPSVSFREIKDRELKYEEKTTN